MNDRNKHIITILITSILITIFYNLNISDSIKYFTIPFTLMIISNFYLLKDKNNNKKSLVLLIPISLILISNLVFKIALSNIVINYFITPFLISIIFHYLTNKNYSIKDDYLLWIFKIFPTKLYKNLKEVTPVIKKVTKLNTSALKGITIGTIIGIIIYNLLISADSYFSEFMSSIFSGINVSKIFMNALIFTLSFIILNSIVINIIVNKKDKMTKIEKLKINKSTIIPILVIINTIFILFLISEISKLTTNFLELPIMYTYAKYAREGFFQLLFVTIIIFSIITFINYKTTLIKDNKVIKVLTIPTIIFTIILILNSFYRMYLYIDSYSFTILRMQVILFLLLELIIFINLLIKIIRQKSKEDSLFYFVLAITTYIINLYICNEQVINKLNELIFK